MATTAMTKILVKELKKDISTLLGRGRKAFPCPFDLPELQTLWHNMLPPDTVAAYKLLKDREFDISSLCTWNVKFTVELDNKRYELQLVDRTRSLDGFLDAPYNEKNPDVAGSLVNNIHLRGARQMAHALPDIARYPAFITWIENMAIIERDFAPALGTLNTILDWCNTIGQLVRAVPDLYKYLPLDRQKLLKQQGRSSNMPYEWASFDRTRVDNLQFSMAKASLLPEQKAEWGDIFQTGAHFA